MRANFRENTFKPVQQSGYQGDKKFYLRNVELLPESCDTYLYFDYIVNTYLYVMWGLILFSRSRPGVVA